MFCLIFDDFYFPITILWRTSYFRNSSKTDQNWIKKNPAYIFGSNPLLNGHGLFEYVSMFFLPTDSVYIYIYIYAYYILSEARLLSLSGPPQPWTCSPQVQFCLHAFSVDMTTCAYMTQTRRLSSTNNTVQ